MSVIPLELADEGATVRLGEDIAAILKPGDVLTLGGDLGVGKTTLARAIIRALAGDPELDVPSPTFTLVQSYQARLPVHHFDLYRLTSPEELEELGFAEAGDGVTLVEWPERAGDLMPVDAVTVSLDESGAGRAATVSGPDGFMDRLRRSLEIRAFLDAAGHPGASRRFLVGDASTRAYETVTPPDGSPVILMNAPRQPDGPPIRGGKPYSQIAHLAESVVPFVAVDKCLLAAGFAAPAIYSADLDRGLLLIEHLGSEGVLDLTGAPVPERYIAAAQMLAAMHRHSWPTRLEAAPGLDHDVPSYDETALAIETELITDWYMPFVAGRPTTDEEREAFATAWRRVFRRLEAAEKKLVLRDFHSPNIIWRENRQGHDRVGILDFQDALIGPSAYDVASLALDARVDIAPDLEHAIVEAYCAERQTEASFDRAAFDEAYAIMAAQRNSKILGIFVRLNERDGKPFYLRHLPRIRQYLERALAHPALAEIRGFYENAGIIGKSPAATIPHSAMLLAAGLGKRMRPLTDTVPKPLIVVAGKPLLDWGLDALERARVERAIVNVHYFGGQIVDHLRHRKKPAVFISDESVELLDSAGGIVKALSVLGEDPFFVVNADTFWIDSGRSNLERLALAWDGARMDILLMLADPGSATGHSGSTDFVADEAGRLARAQGAPEGLIYAGAAILHPRIFAGAAVESASLNLYFDRAIAAGRLFGVKMQGHWLTVGTPDAIPLAEAAVSRIAGR